VRFGRARHFPSHKSDGRSLGLGMSMPESVPLPDALDPSYKTEPTLQEDAALTAAERVLAEYDTGHQAAARSRDAEGLGGGITANAWGLKVDRTKLADAVRRVCDAAVKANGRIMLGFCADDAGEGKAALKAWVTALDLPHSVLHGMDRDGVPMNMSTFGSVYIKYNSQATSQDAPGSAMLSGYAGDFRGVYFNPDLMDGEFRQYAVLPLNVFPLLGPAEASGMAASWTAASRTAGAAARSGVSAEDSEAIAAKAVAKAARVRLRPLLPALDEVGAVAVVQDATADGVVRLRYEGPPELRISVERSIRGTPGFRRIDFVDAAE